MTPVYLPPTSIDHRNIEAFHQSVIGSADRYGAVVVDCSSVERMSASAMRVLAHVAKRAEVRLVNPGQPVRIMAEAFGLAVEMQAPASPYDAHPAQDRSPGDGGHGPGSPKEPRRRARAYRTSPRASRSTGSCMRTMPR